jgi:hypothetical protein
MRYAWCLTALLSSACIVEAPTTDGVKVEKSQATAVPPAQVASGANFSDKIVLEGVVIAPGRGVTGESVRISAAWRTLAPIEADYSVFVHVEDVDGRVDRLNADHPPARGSLPTSKWQVGQVVQDVFEIQIPAGMPVRGLNLVMGLWDPKTDARLKLKNVDQVRNDGRDRVFVATFPVVQP